MKAHLHMKEELVFPLVDVNFSFGESTHKPRVLSAEFLGKLRLLNRTVRWLRENGHVPIESSTLGKRPCIVVNRSASDFLCRHAHGMSTIATGPGNRSIGYVLLDGCEIRWFWESQQ